MVKKVKEEVEEVENPEEEVTPPPEPPAKTYTETEMKALLKGQYDQLNKELSAKGKEVKLWKERAEQPSTSNVDALSMLMEDIEAKDSEFGTPSPRLARAKQLLAEEKQRQVYQQQVRDWETHCNAEKTKIEDKLKEANIDPNGDGCIGIWESYEVATKGTGNFDFANRKADILIKQAKSQIQSKKAEEEEGEEEAKRQKLEEEGKLISPLVKPSGRALTFEEIEKKFGEGDISEPIYLEARKRRGL